MFRTLFLLALTVVAPAATVYDNTANDSLETLFYLDGPYLRIGDSVTLSGSARLLEDATVQFFNAGDDATFDATIQFFTPGTPIGLPFGSPITLTSLFAPSLSFFDVTFASIGYLWPSNDLAFLISVTNITGNASLGLNLFNPDPIPGIGSSSTDSLLIEDSGGFAAIQSGTNSNLYFRLTANEDPAQVPEPVVVQTMMFGLVALVAASRRYR